VDLLNLDKKILEARGFLREDLLDTAVIEAAAVAPAGLDMEIVEVVDARLLLDSGAGDLAELGIPHLVDGD